LSDQIGVLYRWPTNMFSRKDEGHDSMITHSWKFAVSVNN